MRPTHEDKGQINLEFHDENLVLNLVRDGVEWVIELLAKHKRLGGGL